MVAGSYQNTINNEVTKMTIEKVSKSSMAITRDTTREIDKKLTEALEALQAIETLVGASDKQKRSVVMAFIRAERIAKAADEVKAKAKDLALEYMETTGNHELAGDDEDFLKYRKAYDTPKLDTTRLKKEQRELCEQYTKMSHTGATVVKG